MERIREVQNVRARVRPALIKGKTGKTFKLQTILCVLILIFCLFVHFSPADQNIAIKNSISLIVDQNTDLKKVWESFLGTIKNEPALETLSPVSEMMAPARGTIQKDFGIQDAQKEKFHYGVSLLVAEHETVVSVCDGEVTEVATNKDYGTYVCVRHSDEITTLYANLGEVLPNIGDKVTKGQPIAKASGTLLYFELKKGDTYLDPTEFIDFHEVGK